MSDLATLPRLPSLFAEPADSDAFASLLADYAAARDRIERLATLCSTAGAREVLRYFVEGNTDPDRYVSAHSLAAKLFDRDGAIAALNADYWHKALELTDVLSVMPQARRSEWHESIREHNTPEFTAATVAATLGDLLASRQRFFAERVDGVFRALSGEHVTNSPKGFGKRMIIAGVVCGWGYVEMERAGIVNDLRAVIAKFMGRDEPQWRSTSPVIEYAHKQRTGQWVTVDGGALKLRAYKKGTVHVEIHPELVWRLNDVLAYLCPQAIPASHRQPPKHKPKVDLFERPLPFAVLDMLNAGSVVCTPIGARFTFCYTSRDKPEVRAEACRVLESIGGVKRIEGQYAFDYNPTATLAELVASGCVPDRKAHQYYPTPRELAERLVSLARVQPGTVVLEPSAGQGALAEVLQAKGAEVLCVEASKLHCTVLRSKGLTVRHGDFLDMTDLPTPQIVVMNPPFARRQWRAHLDHAAAVLDSAPGSTIAAILPASAAQGRFALSGFAFTFSEPIDNAFAGTSIGVVMLLAQRL